MKTLPAGAASMAFWAAETSVQSVGMKPTGWPVRSATVEADDFERKLGIDLALGAAEMGQQDHLAIVAHDLADGGDQALDAGGIGDFAIGDRHVQIGAQQHALAGEIEFIEGLEMCAHGDPARCQSVPVRSRMDREGEGAGCASSWHALVVRGS